ncbi:type II toxin-antitoxin system RelE/ParE family toxin [Vibrio cincinnatiensis]|uniref:type II toxin-antitoxin system RelE/ParE family toxin n=1 Tax=Vibrio cincinnatiensis TaxID=675 RepID=UPI001EDD3C78|nr:type II toxin-antitoxin system RelE/ParE family toxin [Vibrio cincinnatiensis]MCG3743618.1 type II toxin-antitoxin system RelE/ParE family toxin [Vibrio cincinnatiensis]
MGNVKFYLGVHARADIAKIRQYTIKKWGHNQWEKYKTALFKILQSLANNPYMGVNIEEISNNAFRFPIKNYVIYYAKREDIVVFVGVISTEMSPQKHRMRVKNITDELNL